MNKALIVGIGNQIRQDDGIGLYCVTLLKEQLSREKGKLVDYIIVHQLDVTHSEIFARYDLVVFIDADAFAGLDSFRLMEMLPEPKGQPFTSHIGSIPNILCLAQNLYGSAPKAYLVAVKGFSFEVGEEISLEARNNAKDAMTTIISLIDEFFPLC